jgi:THO complex subunit 4
MPGRALADRISRPRSLSPDRYSGRDRNVDSYVPRGRRGSHSPGPRRRGGRRPGARREGDSQNRQAPRAREARPKKTQEELDAEMADYFNPGGNAEAPKADEPAGAPAAAPATDDVDMIE